MTAEFADLKPSADWVLDLQIAIRMVRHERRNLHLAIKGNLGQAQPRRALQIAEEHLLGMALSPAGDDLLEAFAEEMADILGAAA